MNDAFRMAALWCWYRGEHFHGYQQQQGVRTVQGCLLQAFAAAGFARNPVVAGRTDKGVSARMQVLSGRFERSIALESIGPRLNAHLPGDLQVHLAREAPVGFHAAFSATSKEYRYAIESPGDLASLREAMSLIPGTRDFRVFHFKTSDVRPRTVTKVEYLDDGTLRFVGEGFARYMVRMLVGGLLAVSHRELSLDVFREGLEQQRNFHCPTAPPQPLTLYSVGYPTEVDPFSASDRAGFTSWPPTSSAAAAPRRPSA